VKSGKEVRKGENEVEVLAIRPVRTKRESRNRYEPLLQIFPDVLCLSS
jgi:hypothetical protein